MEIVVMNNKYYLLRWTLLGKRNLYTLDFTDRIMNTYIQYMCNEFDPCCTCTVRAILFCYYTTLYILSSYIHSPCNTHSAVLLECISLCSRVAIPY